MTASEMFDRPRILFVDDEESVLRSLRVSLRKFTRSWQTEFHIGALAALDALAAGSADLVVSDMRMPGMDGATFLEHVREIMPGAVRVVLTGEADPELTARARKVAHRWLSKPCQRQDLVGTVETALAQRTYWQQAEVKDTVADALRSVPELAERDHAERLAVGVTHVLRDEAGLGALSIGEIDAKTRQHAQAIRQALPESTQDVGVAIDARGAVRLAYDAAQLMQKAEPSKEKHHGS